MRYPAGYGETSVRMVAMFIHNGRRIPSVWIVSGLTVVALSGAVGCVLASDSPENEEPSKKSTAKDILRAAPEIVAAPLLVPVMAFSEWRVGRASEADRKSQELYTDSTKSAEDGKYAEAISSLRRSIALRPGSFKYEALGDYENKLGHLTDSIRAYKSAFRAGSDERKWNHTQVLMTLLSRVQMKIGQIYF